MSPIAINLILSSSSDLHHQGRLKASFGFVLVALSVADHSRFAYPIVGMAMVVSVDPQRRPGLIDNRSCKLDGVVKSPPYSVTAFFQDLDILDVCLEPLKKHQAL
jgi:hypothetical protein